jgi:hypothetical protein
VQGSVAAPRGRGGYARGRGRGTAGAGRCFAPCALRLPTLLWRDPAFCIAPCSVHRKVSVVSASCCRGEAGGAISVANTPVVAAPAPPQGSTPGGQPAPKAPRCEMKVYRPPGSDKASQPEALSARGGRAGGRGRGGQVRGIGNAQQGAPEQPAPLEQPIRTAQPAQQHKPQTKVEQPPPPPQQQHKQQHKQREPKPTKQPQQQPNPKPETGAAAVKVKIQKSGFDMQPATNGTKAERGQDGVTAKREQGKGSRAKGGGTSEAYAKFQADQAAQEARARQKREDEALARRLAAEQEAEAEAARKAEIEEANAGPLVKLIKAQSASYWGQVAYGLPTDRKAGNVEPQAAAAISEVSVLAGISLSLSSPPSTPSRLRSRRSACRRATMTLNHTYPP